MKGKKQMTEADKAEAKRLARNAYSRNWKAAHKDKVRKWNEAWHKAQKKETGIHGRKTTAKKQARAT
jgi:hypothetical protein